MDRKEFLKKFVQAGASMCCCGAMMAQGLKADQGWIKEMEKRMIHGSETPGWNKAEKSVNWIKDMMDILDAQLDPEARMKVMHACGRSCYNRAFGVASEEKPGPDVVEQFLKRIESKYEIHREGNRVWFNYSWGTDHQNPFGLIIRDGFCMCPIVESIVPDISPTYCNCSAGYVAEMFKRSLGRPVKVEIIETLQTGGKDCVFRVEYSE